MARLPGNAEDRKALGKYTQEKWERISPLYNYWARHRWRRVIDFLTSNHWRVLEIVNDELDDKRIPKWKKFPTVGLTLGIYSDLMAQWMESQVRYSATSTSADPGDISKAEMGESILKYMWTLTHGQESKLDLGAWLLSTGMGSLGVFWDTNTGNLVPLAIPEKDDQGNPTGELIPVDPKTMQPDPNMSEPVLVDAGEVAVEVLSPQFTRYGPKARDGVMVGTLHTFDEVTDIYGEDVAKVMSFEAIQGSNILDLGWVHGASSAFQEDRGLLIRHFIPRSTRFPNGLWWTATMNGRVISPPAGLVAGKVSIVPFRWIPVPGHWSFGLSPLYDVTHSNKGVDLIKKKQEEWLEKVLPKMLLKSGGGVQVGAFNDEPGQEVAGVHQDAEPEWLVPPAYPVQFDQQRKDGIEEARFVAGYEFRKPSRPLPGQPTDTFRQPSKMKEGNEVKLALLSTSSSWQRLGEIILGFVGKFYTAERTVNIGGPDRMYQWITFKGTDFKNLAADITVDEIPYYPANRQALRDSVVALLGTQAGEIFFTDGEGNIDRDKIQVAAEAVGIDTALSTLDPDVVEARNEISQMRAGQPAEIQSWQNSEVHLAEKFKVVKSMIFKGWDEASQGMLLENIEAHQKALQDQQKQDEEALIAQERSLRTVRAETDAMGETRKALAEKLLDLMFDTLRPPVAESKSK